MPYIAPKIRLIELLEEKQEFFQPRNLYHDTEKRHCWLPQPQPKSAVLQSIASCYHLHKYQINSSKYSLSTTHCAFSWSAEAPLTYVKRHLEGSVVVFKFEVKGRFNLLSMFLIQEIKISEFELTMSCNHQDKVRVAICCIGSLHCSFTSAWRSKTSAMSTVLTLSWASTNLISVEFKGSASMSTILSKQDLVS